MFRIGIITLAFIAQLATGVSAASPPPWVLLYFSGSPEQVDEYYGVSFFEIEGDFPTQHDTERAEGMAKSALARQFESVVSSRLDDRMSDHNGETDQATKSTSSSKTFLQLRTNPPELWFDKEKKRLWARVSMPKGKSSEWVNKAPLKSKKVKVKEVHAVVVRTVGSVVWLKTEEGRKLSFSTAEEIPTRERVVVMYLGASPSELYWEGVKLAGAFGNRR